MPRDRPGLSAPKGLGGDRSAEASISLEMQLDDGEGRVHQMHVVMILTKEATEGTAFKPVTNWTQCGRGVFDRLNGHQNIEVRPLGARRDRRIAGPRARAP